MKFAPEGSDPAELHVRANRSDIPESICYWKVPV